MIFRNSNTSTTLIALAALCCGGLSVEASSFRRDDATLGAQTNRAEQVVVATVAAIHPLGEHDQKVTLQVEQALKGERTVTLTFVADRHTTLTPAVRVGTRALFFLSRRARAAVSSCRDCPREGRAAAEHSAEESRQLVLDRGPRSAVDLAGAGGTYSLALARAHARADRDPGGLLSELVQGVSRAPGVLASDCALELLARVERGARLTTPQTQTLVAAFEQRRDRLSDRAPLVRLLGRAAPDQARAALLRSVADADGFDPGALAEALGRTTGERAAGVLAENLSRNPSRRIRARAARLLGRLAGSEVALSRAARWDPEASVRGEALLALTRRGGASAKDAASAALVDRERALVERKAAALALSELGESRRLAAARVVDVELGRFVQRLRRSPALARHELLRSLRPER